ncbi:MAG: HAD family hydrolase [Dongiaceae bacterium]
MIDAPLARPKAILFDWDSTLADNWQAIHAAMNATLSAMGHATWTIEQSRQRIKSSLRDGFPTIFGENWRQAMTIYRDAYTASHLEHLREMPGAGAMLAALHGSGLYLGVVSNKIGKYLRLEAGHLGWTGYFGRLVGAHDAQEDKPAVAPVELALEGSGMARGVEIWFVGDTDLDMRCAINAGCTPVLMRMPPLSDGEFEHAMPACHVRDCPALARLVGQL